MSKYVKPYYYLEADVTSINYDIRVNDCPVFEMWEAAPVKTKFPLNHWMQNGKNTLLVYLRADPEKRAFSIGDYCKLKVMVEEYDSENPKPEMVKELSYEFKQIVVQHGKSNLTLNTVFNADVNFPLWDWVNALPILDTAGSIQVLTKELELIYNALRNKDLDYLSGILSKRDQDIAVAYYVSYNSQKDETIETFDRYFRDQDLELEPFEKSSLRLKTFGNNRLARIDATDNESPLFFSDVEGLFNIYIPFTFYKDSEGEWHVIR